MKRRYAYYVVFGKDGFVGHVNSYGLAEDIIAEHGGGFCKGAMNLKEVEKYKALYAKTPATQKAMREEYRRLMADYMNGRGNRSAIEKRLSELARMGVSD